MTLKSGGGIGVASGGGGGVGGREGGGGLVGATTDNTQNSRHPIFTQFWTGGVLCPVFNIG